MAKAPETTLAPMPPPPPVLWKVLLIFSAISRRVSLLAIPTDKLFSVNVVPVLTVTVVGLAVPVTAGKLVDHTVLEKSLFIELLAKLCSPREPTSTQLAFVFL